MHRLFFAVLALTLPAVPQTAPSRVAEQVQLDSSETLFSVMAAINAAGYDAEADSPANSPMRALVRREIAARGLPIIEELKTYFQAHRQRDWTAELSQYVSFALSVEGPPDFAFRFKPQELPPDVVPLEGFRALLGRFHRDANLASLWSRVQPAYEEAIARYQHPAIESITAVNAYSRNTGGGTLGSRFRVFVELLGPPNQIQTRSYRNDYFVVVTPSPEPQTDDVRHGYLHYLIDPLGVRYAEELNKKRSLADFAQGAPALEDFYKRDFLLLSTESLIKAVEARLAPPARRPELIDRAVKEGFVLTAGFADALVDYEKQQQSLRFYFPDLVAAIDLKRETERLDQVEFARERAPRAAKVVPAERAVEPAGAYKTLDLAEQAYQKRELPGAKDLYMQALRETGEQPAHARAYYGLARIAALQNDPGSAEQLFERALASSPDDYVKGWALVYLARLADAAGDRDRAVERYRAAAAVPGASAAARKAAEKGLQEAFRK